MTYDQAALTIMVSNKTQAQKTALLRALAKKADQDLGQECPDCGCRETEDNGCRGYDLEFRCCECDHRWGPAYA